MSTEVRLRKWIATRLVVPPAPVLFRLLHVGVIEDGERQQVSRLHDARPVALDGSAGAANGEALRLAREIWEVHDGHQEGFEGLPPQSYSVYAYSRNDDGKLRKGVLHHWRTQTGELVGLARVETEPPNARGERAMQMRHNEALVRHLIEMSTLVAGGNKAIMDEQAAMISHLTTGHLARLQAMEEMLSEKHMRDITTAEFVGSEERKGAMMTKVIDTVIPEIGSAVRRKLLGGKGASATAAPAPAPASSPAEASSSSAPANGNALAGDERAELRDILFGLPEELADKLMESLSKEKKERLLTIAGTP